MKFLKLFIDNYKSFQKPVEINLDITDADKNIVLIGGMNGAGKTAILEAINICLYGERKEKLYKAINRRELDKGNGNILFELHILLDDGDVLKVKRSWRCASHGLNKITSSDLEEKLVLVRNEQRLAISDQGGWQDFLEKTIPYGISQFFFFNGEKIEYMASDEDSEGRLKESIEALLGIERAKQLLRDLEELRKEQRKKRSDITDDDIKAKEIQLDSDRKKIEEWKKELSFLEKELNELNEKASDLETEFTKRFGISSFGSSGLKQDEIRLVQLNSRKAEIDKEIREFCTNILPFSLLSNKFFLVLDQIQKERQFRQAKHGLKAREELVDQLIEKLYQPDCVACNKPFDIKKKDYLQKEILSVFQENARQKEESSDVEPILNLSEMDERKIEAQLSNERGVVNLKELLNERESVIKEVQKLEGILKKTSVDNEDKDALRELQIQRDEIQQNIGRRKQEIRYLDERIAEKDAAISSMERELTTLYEKYTQDKGKVDIIVKIGSATKVLTEFIERLRVNKLEELRQHIFTMYRMLASKSDLIADIVIDPLTYRIKIIDKHGTSVNKQNLSAGEKEVFAISLLWGLAKTSKYKLPVIIDTPLARLDSLHRDAIVSKYFPEAGEQVVILSTDTEVDQNYYKRLEPHLSRVNKLLFDRYRELTTLEEGYFWGENNGR
ncbi:MAG: DNA sulfur modification protein DndD [Omnitrophica WOR_2 bacterium GWF2_38_59]|nr:MAG: DNA sulfur modification protein DndD [Omnitrophica WOR_2 bacterium GWF2_38_59]OGX50487.1 MAG: DNA sulfur modification protein DndD [Omnitrophica WOR_2 bacterium RIFOXYA2_FULL_38_17]OGX59496.1 MAG: DNA sulfur modification protein DndD [Omnitrophica WOR_2 bacterium RIFOXYB2_FULL_38_16]HBG62037.1 DNA sulfur modification protein DndD [Candidatus Omnitrophota bacterium]